MDESEGPHGGFVLGGILSSPERWASFSAEWEQMLPHGTLSKRNGYHFKIDEMLDLDERIDRIAWFYDIIYRHAKLFLSFSLSTRELKNAQDRILAPGLVIDWGHFRNPYLFAFRRLFDSLHENRDKMNGSLDPEEQIDFFFDDRSDKSVIRKFWSEYLDRKPEYIAKRYGNEPRFERDEVFLPLQAADFWAGWIRIVKEGQWRELSDRIFKKREGPSIPWIEMHVTEDDITKLLGHIAAKRAPGKVYDRKTGMELGDLTPVVFRDLRKRI